MMRTIVGAGNVVRYLVARLAALAEHAELLVKHPLELKSLILSLEIIRKVPLDAYSITLTLCHLKLTTDRPDKHPIV